MPDNVNLLSTPENYATPDQLKSMRAYGAALLQDSQRPIQHWTQGLQSVVSALVGGHQTFKANQMQNESDAVRAGRMMPDTTGRAPDPGKETPIGTPPMSGTKTSDTDLDRASKATASLESGGRYDAEGPVTKTGDRAYGKYGVMGANLPEWTPKYAGRSMTPEEFKNDPKAQDAVFRGEFSRLAQKHGPEGAARAWFAGEGGMNDPNRKDILGTTVAGYGDRFKKAYGQDPNASMAQVITGEPKVTPVSDTQVAAGSKAAPTNTSPRPDPTAGTIYVDPALVARRPRLNEGQIRGILADPTITEPVKMGIRQEYINQDAPIDVPWPGGVVRIDPRNPTIQQFIPEGKWGKSKVGDVETDSFMTPSGKGPVYRSPIVPLPGTTGPRSDVAPDAPAGTVAPAAAPQGGAPAPAAPAPVIADNAPAAPAAAPTAVSEAVPNTGGVQVASLDPAAGVAQAAAAAEKSAAPADNPLAKWAQAAPPKTATPEVDPILEKLKLNNFPQDLIDDYVAKKAYDNAQALKMKKGEADISVEAEAQKKTNEAASKRYDEYIATIAPATDQRQNISMARAAADDPNFYGGTGDAFVEGVKKIKSALGIDPDAAAPMEVFRKTTAQSIMSGLKTAFGGLGQIRVAEIELQKTANASTNNSPTAIRALLTITDRNAEKIEQIGGMATAYKAGEAVMDPKHPDKVLIPANKLGPDGQPVERHGVDAKFERVLQAWRKVNPTFTTDEEKALMHSLKDTTGAPKAAEAPAGGWPVPPAGAISDLNAKPETKAFFERHFGPGSADKHLKPAPPVSK